MVIFTFSLLHFILCLPFQVEDNEATEKDDSVDELKEIHVRKMMIQQKLEQFHHRQSLSHDKTADQS